MPEQGSLRLPRTQQRTTCMSESRREPHCTKARAKTRLTVARRVTSPHCQARYRPIWATTPSYFYAYTARAAMIPVAEDGTDTIITDNWHRHCPLESSNNSEDERETHYL